MLETLPERYSVILRTVAELIFVISGIIYLALVCLMFPTLVWYTSPIIVIPIAIFAALFFKILDHSLTDGQALLVIFVWLPLMIYSHDLHRSLDTSRHF